MTAEHLPFVPGHGWQTKPRAYYWGEEDHDLGHILEDPGTFTGAYDVGNPHARIVGQYPAELRQQWDMNGFQA